jgi:hypothetical protein
MELTVLLGGGAVYAFSDPAKAEIQYTVMIGSNLDVDRWTGVSREKWEAAKEEAVSEGVEIVEMF